MAEPKTLKKLRYYGANATPLGSASPSENSSQSRTEPETTDANSQNSTFSVGAAP